MIKRKVAHLAHWCLALTLFLSAFGSTWAAINRPGANLHPLLSQMAAESPDQMVAVIVQKSDQSGRAEELAVRLGGTITKELTIINSFVAKMTASAVQALAASSAVRWVSLDAPLASAITPTVSSATKFSVFSTKIGTTVANGFTNSANMLSAIGIDGVYGYGTNVKGAFAGFTPEYAAGQMITKVEIVVRVYASTSLATKETPKFTAYVAGKAGSAVALTAAALNNCVGVSKVCSLAVDITATRSWSWADFSNNLEIVLDQSAVATTHTLYYDTLGLRLTTATGSDTTSPLVLSSEDDSTAMSTTVLANVFQKATRAENIWNESPYWQGSGMTVAVVDSGSFKTNAIGKRFIGEVNFNSAEHNANDRYGHGTFVTSLIADDGEFSAGKYMGMAPRVNILGVRVSDDMGVSSESDVVNALQWIYNNKTTYNIRVVNLSLNSTVKQSYHTSPLDAAAEILWFNGIVVVASAGNNGTAALYPPANDPFVITVGATNDLTTASLTDDLIAAFSAYGVDESGGVKPDLVAPGANLIAYLPDTNQLTISQLHTANRVDANYFRMSGTSMAAPLVSGAVAILLQSNATLTPDQVKYRLKATANKNWPGYNATTAGAGYLDVYAAVKGTTTQSSNTGIAASQLLWTGTSPVTWGSVSWSSVNWSSVNWSSVNWSSVNWSSVNWSSDYWDNGVTGASVAPGAVETLVAPDNPSNTALGNEEGATPNALFLPLVVR